MESNGQHTNEPSLGRTESNNAASSGIDFDLSLLIHILRKSWYWMVLIIFLFTGGAYTYIHYTQPIYESSSVIQIVRE